MFSSDIKAFKKQVMSHFKDSHGYTAFTYPQPPLKEIAKICYFVRESDGVGEMLVQAGLTNRFWHTFRNSGNLAGQLAGQL